MISRIFFPGSEWLYFKLYTGIKSADTLLVDTLYPSLLSLKKTGHIKKFFFIRYRDEYFHLRLRLHLTDNKNFTKIFEILSPHFETCTNNGLLWNIQIDTYKREIERYGENIIDVVESIFCVDSDIIIQLIGELNKSKDGEHHRWLLSLILVDDLLSQAGYDLNKKYTLLNNLSESFKREFNSTSRPLKKQLSDRYRLHKSTIFEILNNRNNGIIRNYLFLIDERIKLMGPCFQKIIEANKKNQLNIPINSLISSVIHMMMNRMFRAKNRMCEMVIYDFLHRYYESTIARNKKNE